MLIIARNIHQLSFLKLMNVYYNPQKSKQWENDFYTYLTECFFTEARGTYAIWEEQGNYVSALRLEPYKDGLLVSCLGTASEHRRRGYAQRLMEAVLDQNCGKVYSHVKKDNTASLALHDKLGFRRIGETARYLDGSIDGRCCTLLAMGRRNEG